MYEPLIVNGSTRYGNNRWLSYSSKLKRHVYLFSDLEYEHWLLIETNPRIVEYCEQPLLMAEFVNGKLYKSIIDMWVKYDDGHEEFIEIKYSSELIKEDVKRQIAVQKKWCSKNEVKHHVRTEEFIGANKLLLSNLKLLMKGNKQQKQQIETDSYQILKILKQHCLKKVTINTLIEETQIPQNRFLLSIGKMILQGEVRSDISQKHFGKNTEVWINE